MLKRDYRYQKKQSVVRAAQWDKNGDHPMDECPLCHDSEGKPFLGEGKVVRRFRHPLISGDAVCAQCSNTMLIHGWIDAGEKSQAVCPGDFVCTDEQGNRFAVKPDVFQAMYEPAEAAE